MASGLVGGAPCDLLRGWQAVRLWYYPELQKPGRLVIGRVPQSTPGAKARAQMVHIARL
ncbi:MAG: hypothetical protein AAGC57_15835 [Pseudomonadota bacterium]